MFNTLNYNAGIMFRMANNFASWLNKIINDRGLTQAEVARKSDLSKASISGILSGSLVAGYEAVIKVSRGLNVSPVEALIAADYWPSMTIAAAAQERLVHQFTLLSEKDQQTVLDMIEFLLSK